MQDHQVGINHLIITFREQCLDLTPLSFDCSRLLLAGKREQNRPFASGRSSASDQPAPLPRSGHRACRETRNWRRRSDSLLLALVAGAEPTDIIGDGLFCCILRLVASVLCEPPN